MNNQEFTLEKGFERPYVVETLGEELIERIHTKVVRTSEVLTDVKWSALADPTSNLKYFDRFFLNTKWKSLLDPIVFSSPRIFHSGACKEYIAPLRFFSGKTDIFLGSDRESLIVKFPLSTEGSKPEVRQKYLIVETSINEYINFASSAYAIEDNLELFPHEITSITVPELFNKLGIK